MNAFINGIKCYTFGVNNYSEGMNPATVNPKDHSIEEIRSTEEFFLNPFMEPNKLEIFCLIGTKEQFEKFYESGKEAYATKKAIKELGGVPDIDDKEGWKELHKLEKKAFDNFSPWYKM